MPDIQQNHKTQQIQLLLFAFPLGDKLGVVFCRYMKYLYPYECDKRGLSNPNELQAAIDSNRREGRRQSFSSSLFTYSPNGTPTMLSSPKLPSSSMSLPVSTNGASLTPIQKIKKGELSA